MSEHWNPTEKETEEWLDQKIHKFVIQESRTLQLSEKRWLDRYVYTKIYKIFFASFPSELYDWIMRLADSQGRYKINQPIVWTPQLVHRLEASEDKIAGVVDHWLDLIINGFITEFVVDMITSYSKAE